MEITSNYRIKYTNGDADDTCESYEEALRIVRGHYGERAYAEQFADRALVWRDEQESRDDDGTNAIAAIYAE